MASRSVLKATQAPDLGQEIAASLHRGKKIPRGLEGLSKVSCVLLGSLGLTPAVWEVGREALKTGWAQFLPLLQPEARKKVSLVRSLLRGCSAGGGRGAWGGRALRGRGCGRRRGLPQASEGPSSTFCVAGA